MMSDNHQTDVFFDEYIERFLSENKAARCLNDDLSDCGVGLMPLVDHCTLRTLDVNARAKDLLRLGFSQDQTLAL